MAGTIMSYLTLDSQLVWVHGYHLVILNNMRWRKRVNIPFFLYKELERFVKDFQIGGMKYALHQGLFTNIAKFLARKQGWIGELETFRPMLRSRGEETPGEAATKMKSSGKTRRSSKRKVKCMMMVSSKNSEEDSLSTN